MAKWRKGREFSTTNAVRPSNAIVSAAQRIRPDLYNNIRIPVTAWQTEAWRQYEICGELGFACTWLGNALSRCSLIGVDVDGNGQFQLEPTKNKRVQALVAGFAGSPGRQAEMMMQFGTHMTVPGDCYVVAPLAADGTFESWNVYSTVEVSAVSSGRIQVDTGDGFPRVYSLDSTLVIRVYRPHPRRSWEADSPTRRSLPVLREMEQLTKYIFAVIDSRLATAGILGVPSEMEFPSPGDDIQPGESPLMALLAQVFLKSIEDRNSAAAVVPIVLQGPADAIDKIRWMTPPNAELTTYVSDLRDKAIRRLALDLDMPPEVLLGVATSNHWGSWAIEEQSIKLHIEPVMTLICSALTEGYLKAALAAEGLDPNRFAFWFDSSRLVLRPNRATDAKDLYDRGEINGETLRRETGFSESDAPQGQEKCVLDLLAVIKASPRAADAMLPVLLPILGLDKCGITTEQIDSALAPPPAQDGTPPLPSGGPPLNPDPNAPPVPGQNGNGG